MTSASRLSSRGLSAVSRARARLDRATANAAQARADLVDLEMAAQRVAFAARRSLRAPIASGKTPLGTVAVSYPPTVEELRERETVVIPPIDARGIARFFGMGGFRS